MNSAARLGNAGTIYRTSLDGHRQDERRQTVEAGKRLRTRGFELLGTSKRNITMDTMHLAPSFAADVGSKVAGSSAKEQVAKDSSSEARFSEHSHQPQNPRSSCPRPHKLVLCFDGTGNKFRGDESDSNILKIFRMLDRTARDQYHYYQPGIGTYVVSNNLSHGSLRARFKANMQKAKDSAIGSSFDQHVVGGYRFLMRFYSPGDEIYIFGFSRGAYIARFLAEMLDYVGLLSHGNEEMVAFAWRAFAQWQCRRGAGGDAEHGEAEPFTEQKAEIDAEPDEKKKAKLRKNMRNVREAMDKDRAKVDELYTFLKGFRETFSRPVRRIRFLGLFDTVNSVPRFETAWMERHGSKFPYTARTSAKVIRHAVSIDERRAKFRQDLIYQSRSEDNGDKKENRLEQKLHHMRDKYRCHHNKLRNVPDPRSSLDGEADPPRGRRVSKQLDDEDKNEQERHLSPGLSMEQPERYRIRSRSRSRSLAPSMRHADFTDIPDASDVEDGFDSEDETDQDIDEVWFSGGHGDVGGGWSVKPGEGNASHVPLAWMVREAMRAGLTFDMEKVVSMGCAGPNCQRPPQRVPNIRVNSIPQSSITLTDTETAVGYGEHHTAPIHDSLAFNGGLTHMATLSWRLMEWLPFRRMDLQPDGSWQPIRWPLPRGETRDMPADARIHGSVIKRMQADENYRPGNLIVGGGGRGLRRAPKEYGMGEWVCVGDEGDEIGEVWVKKLT
ncbi:uncharacterized protein PgNI_09089 [Pyricularia grisea]|uniref:T6SS Phospholipase effector Tle1-like catalytic domain-containing protein n=1 Tax=Pyricularia grisea TaxID=148305 RepID=A0A6P8ASL7_PYRGI|nr:uncharacterized protein PgNI_09089 [Pyricularia grisea]TLD05098.1 hypothetical protein PgNI_09089 [Pyricularia grisea]